jgi:hypothetical protein
MRHLKAQTRKLVSASQRARLVARRVIANVDREVQTAEEISVRWTKCRIKIYCPDTILGSPVDVLHRRCLRRICAGYE